MINRRKSERRKSKASAPLEKIAEKIKKAKLTHLYYRRKMFVKEKKDMLTVIIGQNQLT